MKLQELVREDLWNAIKQHYETEDYTESLRDAAFLLKDILQNKSGEYDKDNGKLVDAVLMGANPVIKINNYSTQSEKDFQMGLATSIKGIFLHVRNPISHEKTIYSCEDANAILLYIDYIIRQIDKSTSMTLVDEWMPLLINETFTDTEEYAKELIKELPKKKTLELLYELYEQRENLPHYRLQYFLRELINNLTNPEKYEFVQMLNHDLAQTDGEYALSMFFHYFAPYFYSDLKKVVKLRIEDVVYHGIETAELKDKKAVGKNAAMATWAKKSMDMFITKEKIIELIRKRVLESREALNYIMEYYYSYVNIRNDTVLAAMKEDISIALLFNPVAYDFLKRFIWDKTSALYTEFQKDIDKYEERFVAEKDRIPEKRDWI